jgi:hypothetical protein
MHTQDGPTFGGGTHIVQRAFNGENVSDFTGQDVIEYFDKLIAESDKPPPLGTLLALDMAARAPAALSIATGAAAAPAAGAAAGVASVKEQKKRKPKFSPGKYDVTTSEEDKDEDIPEKDDDIPEKDDDIPDDIPPPPPPIEGLRSPTEPFTFTEIDDMHKRIMQKCAPIIDGFSSLNIFEVSYVEHKLKEIKSAFKKDYDRNNQYVKFFKKANKQGKTQGNADVKGGAKGRKKK